jgi:hydroxyacylglutathione hydrolase
MNDKNSSVSNQIKRFEVGPLPTNCFALNQRYLVDPGGMSSSLEQFLSGMDSLEAILLTHSHWDHIAAIDQVLERFPECRILCHSEEFDMLSDPEKNFSQMSGQRLQFEADAPIESARLPVGDDTLEVLFTPGHSPGGVSLYWRSEQSVLCGDALFKGGIGRTDLPGSDRNRLDESLQDVLLTLPEETDVFPGHGPSSTIRREKENNPFL